MSSSSGQENVTQDGLGIASFDWDKGSYQHGTRYGHVALEVGVFCCLLTCCWAGATVLRDPGPMTHAIDETGHREVIAFTEDPDDCKIELIQVYK